MSTEDRPVLEEMASFFDARVDGYERHMLENIEGARTFYPLTARHMRLKPGARVLDLGCGTGLELDEVFALCPDARVTGVDLSPGMLEALRRKHGDRALELTCGSYFDVPFGEEIFDAAVSVETLHHFDRAKKTGLYRKIFVALKRGGVYVETDYVAPTPEYEAFYFAEGARLRAEAGEGAEFYHYDTPHTAAHLREMLLEAGFDRVERVWESNDCTAVLVAEKL